MGILTQHIENDDNILQIVASKIDPVKYSIPLTDTLFINDKWVEAESNSYEGWCPDIEQVNDEDFECCFVFYWAAKDVWCYRYSFGTYVYDIKSVAELELILAREGFDYSFEL